MKESFVFYKSFYDAIKKIPEEYQLELYNAILSYSLEGTEPSNLSPIAEAMFILIRPNIDSSQKRYEASVENGKRGGRPKAENLTETQEEPRQNLEETQRKPNTNLTETQEEPRQNLNVDVDDNVDVNVDDNVDVNVDDNVDVKDDVKKENKRKEKRNKIIKAYNTFCTNLPQMQKLTDKRKTAIDKFIKEFTEEEIEKIFYTANTSKFLTGHNDRGWKADFDFIMRIDKATAILEGKYNTEKVEELSDWAKLWKEAKESEQSRNNTANILSG